MKKKASKNSLVLLMKEDVANLLATQAMVVNAPKTDLSLDEKVDHFLIQYERESVPMSAQYTQESNTSLKALMGYLFEADEPKEGEEEEPPADLTEPPVDVAPSGGLDFGGAPAAGNDMSAAPGGDGGPAQAGAAPVPTPRINVSNFAKSVAKLASNYQTLIDPKRIILNRAQAYIEKNYNPAIAKEMMTILDTEYNMTPKSVSAQSDETPISYGAGALEPLG